jgi:HD superfamily phosphodiesterase
LRPELIPKLEKLVEEETSAAAVADWIQSQSSSDEPLYNYRLDHIRQVVEISDLIASRTGADRDLVSVAAWMHDLAKPGSGRVENHGKKSAARASGILRQESIEPSTISRISEIIEKHVGLTLEKRLEPLEAQVLWEADKIVKLGAVGLLHFILNGIRIHPGRDLLTWAGAMREYISLAERIAESMHTDIGKEMASERIDAIRDFSERLDSELTHGANKDV